MTAELWSFSRQQAGGQAGRGESGEGRIGKRF